MLGGRECPLQKPRPEKGATMPESPVETPRHGWAAETPWGACARARARGAAQGPLRFSPYRLMHQRICLRFTGVAEWPSHAEERAFGYQ